MTAFHQERPLRVLIAGGAAGVGRACADVLAGPDVELILCDIDGMGLTDAGVRLNAFTRYCDAVEELSVAIFAAEVGEKFRSIDVLINTVGRGYVRALAMMRLARAFMPLLRSGSGRRLLVNVAPAGGYVASRDMFPYASSLGAFERLSDALAEQVKGTSIQAVTLVPKLLRGPQANADAGRLYQLQRVDEQHTAECIAGLVMGTSWHDDSRRDHRSEGSRSG